MSLDNQIKPVRKIKSPKPVVLLILDGWGVAPTSRSNAISSAKTPAINKLTANYPVMTLQASGEAVGLGWGEMGNSEVGHINLGTGQIIYQNLPRINKSITDGTFFKNKVFLEAAARVKRNSSALHLIGLVSGGGVHSHQNHLFALLDFCKEQRIEKVYIHAILDGRDTAKDAGIESIQTLEDKIKECGVGEIASLSGRFFAMDRDNRWERTAKAYQIIAWGKSEITAEDPAATIKKSYAKKIYDEEFIPTAISRGGQAARVTAKDAVIFFNFRADRARQLTEVFTLPGFNKFSRGKYLKDLFFATLTEYDKDFPVAVAFPPQIIKNPLAKIIADNKLTQLHAAETEKYAHVTFFFNGGREKPFLGEQRILVPSPMLSNYDLKPEMSAFELTDKVLAAISKNKFDFIVINFANADMVGHTGNLEATIKAAQAVDRCVEQIVKLTLKKDGVVLITADHGNAEEVLDQRTGEIDKEHSANPVPLIIVGKKWAGQASKFGSDLVGTDLAVVSPSGMLSDVAPTILKIMGLPIPKEMVGGPLI